MSELKFTEGKYGVIETLPDVPVILMSGKQVARWIELHPNLIRRRTVLKNIESGLHHTEYKSLAKRLADLGGIMICTTQSREFIRAAHQVFSEIEGYPFCYIRADWVDYIKGTAPYWELIAYEKDVLEASFNMNVEIR